MDVLLVCAEADSSEDYVALSRRLKDRLFLTTVSVENLEPPEKTDAPQIMILDAAMPREEILVLCGRLRSFPGSYKRYLFVVLPSREVPKIEEYLAAGVDNYLVKPLHKEQFAGQLLVAERLLINRIEQTQAQEERSLPVSFVSNGSAGKSFSDTEREKLLAAAVEQSNVSILLTTAELKLPGPQIVFINSGFTKMTGYEKDQIIGKTPRILQGPKTNQKVLEKLRTQLEQGEHFAGETVNYRKDGTCYDLEWQISPVRDEVGKVTHFLSVQNDVTLLKQNEAQFHESRQYQYLFNLVNDPVILFDPVEFRVLTVNNKACEIYKVPRENFINRSLTQFWQDPRREKAMLKKLLAEGVFEEFETIHYRADSSMMHVLINSTLVEYEGKQAVLSIKRDITQRKLAEQNIQRAKQEWSDTVDSVSDLIILEDSKGDLRRCNRATRDFFQTAYTDLIGRAVNELIPQTVFSDNISGADKQTPNFIEHLRQPTWEGQLFGREDWYEITNNALPPDNEERTSWVHIIKNITARRQSEAETQRLYTAIEQGADAVLITDLSGTIQYVNSSFESITGWKRLETIGRKVSEVKKSLHDYRPIDEIFLALGQAEMWEETYQSVRRNGEVFDEQATVSLVRDAVGNPLNYVFVCRDVTEARRLESITEAVNMMENVGYIFSGIRHELGNPINSIKTALTVLRNNLERWEREQIQIYVERCLSEMGRVEYLLKTLRTFSMHENPQVQPVEINAYLENFISLVREDFTRRGIKMQLDLNDKAGHAFCDSRALHQVMLNLLANAADALEERAEPIIRIEAVRQKNHICITIEDNGIGMNETQYNNLFKPFYTSKTDGTGLGLVIVRKMLVKMNGAITIESRFNVGTIVQFTLEAAKSNEE